MKKVELFLDLKFVKEFLESVSSEHKILLQNFINTVIDIPINTFSMKRGRINCMVDLYKLYSFDLEYYFSSFNEYYNTKSTKEKIRIRFGEDRVKDFNEKFSSRARGQVISIYTTDYWLKRGFTFDESTQKISEIQQKNSLKRSKDSYKNASLKMPISIDYWHNIGYTIDEAEILRQPYLRECKNDLDSLIYRYGEDEGLKRYKLRCSNYTNSMSKSISSRRTGGYVSKESLVFFKPLYKFCRKLGIQRKDIYFGIKGSKEFFIRDNSLPINGGYFYDFTIPSLNMVVEYHGTFWHPKNPSLWKNPFLSYDEAKIKDGYKQLIAENFGFSYFIVWSDDNKLEKFAYLREIILKRYYEQQIA